MHDKRKELLTSIIYKQYGCLTMSREITAEILNISTSKLDRLKSAAIGPKWSKDKRSKNGKVTYAIDHIADYIICQETFKTV